MTFRLIGSVGLVAAIAAMPLSAQVAAVGKVTLATGPHAGTHTIESEVGCRISPDPRSSHEGFSVNLTSEAMRRSRGVTPNAATVIHVDIPNDESAARLTELEVHVYFGDPMSRRTPGTIYHMNTRPIDGLDTLVARHDGKRTVDRKPEGRGGATLHKRGGTASLEFWAETATGVRIDGTIDCRQIDRY